MQNKRRQVEDREQFTEEERSRIVKKSSERCVWCGKKVYFGYGATVDHYVPLKKGGTNDKANLVLMCKDCNEQKGSKIVPLSIGCRYLNEPYKQELDDYFDNYINRYDYISRGNVLACDIYPIYLLPECVCSGLSSGKKNRFMPKYITRPSYMLKRAYPEDEEKILSYYIKYLKKYNVLDDEQAAKDNIQFWMRFGSIYYVENNNEISVIATCLVNKHNYVSFNVFPYYSNLKAETLAGGVTSCLISTILEENKLPYLPVCTNMLANDELTSKLLGRNRTYQQLNSRMMCSFYYTYDKRNISDSDVQFVKDQIRLSAFLHKFGDIEDIVQDYVKKNKLSDTAWMAEEIVGRDLFDEPLKVTYEQVRSETIGGAAQ